MSDALVEAEALSKRFAAADKSAIDALTTTVKSGRVVGLVGPDGAGKTTLMRLMAALLSPTSGRLSVLGFDSRDEPAEFKPLSAICRSASASTRICRCWKIWTCMPICAGGRARARAERSTGCSTFTDSSDSPAGSPASCRAA